MVAVITYASRIAGALVMSRFATSQRIDRFLGGLSVSVIAALVASIIAQGGLREAAAAASLVMLGSRSAVWALIVGIACAAAWSAVVPHAGGALLSD